MSFLKVLPAVTGVLIAILGITVFVKSKRQRAHLVFSLLCLGVFIWEITYSISGNIADPVCSFPWNRAGLVGIVFIPALVVDFVVATIRTKNPWLQRYVLFLYGFGLLALILSPFDVFLHVPAPDLSGHITTAGPFFVYFMLVFASSFISAILLLRPSARKKATLSPEQYSLQRVLFYAFLVTLLSVADLLRGFGVPIYPIGYLTALIWIALMTFAILRLHLMDLDVVIRRGTYFLLLVLLLILPVSLLTSHLTSLFSHVLGAYSSIVAALIWTVILLFSDWVKEILGILTDKLLYQKDYDVRKVLHSLIQDLQSIASIRDLIYYMNQELTEKLNVSFCLLIKSSEFMEMCWITR
ncbi:MAG: histidine kinase N-terminal 7TM domain-containing protein [Candidatus Margulisiibacteriota bacterium]